MIITEQKPYQELLDNLENDNSVIIIGCGLCAKTAKTGGENEVKELKDKLVKDKIKVLHTDMIDAVCDERLVRLFINKNKKVMEQADSVIIMSCGAGVQAFKHLRPETRVHAPLNTLFLATEKRLGEFYQFCSLCGNCVLDLTNGICPVTRCPKGYINGPCGGAKNNKCEADSENDCVWHIIIDSGMSKRVKNEIIEYKDYKKQFHPRKINYQGTKAQRH